MNRRQRLRNRIFVHGMRWSDKVYGWLYENATGPKWLRGDRAYEILTPHDMEGWAAKWLCRVFAAHYATEDHCLKPEHDYCLFCGKRMPGQGPNIERRQEYLASMRAKYAASHPTQEETN